MFFREARLVRKLDRWVTRTTPQLRRATTFMRTAWHPSSAPCVVEWRATARSPAGGRPPSNLPYPNLRRIPRISALEPRTRVRLVPDRPRARPNRLPCAIPTIGHLGDDSNQATE